MLIALNLIVAAVIVGGITGVIVHAVRINDDRGNHGLREFDQLLRARAAKALHAAERHAHQPAFREVNPSRG